MSKHLNTGCKPLDTAGYAVYRGAFLTPIQHSHVVRAWSKTKWSGGTVAKGFFQTNDLKNFPRIPQNVFNVLKDESRDQDILVYEIYRRKVIFGYILFRGKRMIGFYPNYSVKGSRNALHTIAQKLSSDYE